MSRNASESFRFTFVLPAARLCFGHETNHKRSGVNAVEMAFLTIPEKIVPTDTLVGTGLDKAD